MPIIIPSKNIYSYLNNDKVKNNKIGVLEYKTNIAKFNSILDTSLSINSIFGINYEIASEDEVENKPKFFQEFGTDLKTHIAYLDTTSKYIKGTIEIDRNLGNAYAKEFNNKFDITLFGVWKAQPVMISGEGVYDQNSKGFVVNSNSLQITNSGDLITYEGELFLPIMPQKIEHNGKTVLTGNENLTKFEISSAETEKGFVQFYALREYFTLKMEHTLDRSNVENNSFSVEARREIFTINEIQVTAFGTKTSLSLEETTRTIGEGTSNNYTSFDGNELIQTTNHLLSGKDFHEYLYSVIKEQNKNGKETAEILCDINEYKDEGGELVISSKTNELPMSFDVGDVVIPMVFSQNGIDVPMSKYIDGSAKQFVVVKTNEEYDGATFQKLTLKEKYKEI